MIIPLSEPHEQSINFVKVEGAVSRDFDGLLTCTVLYNGVPVAYLTHPDSNYADAGDGMPGFKLIMVDGDLAQEQVFAHFYEWIGEAFEPFAEKVAEMHERPYAVTVAETDKGHRFTTYKQYGIWDAFDEYDYLMADGHPTCTFIDRLEAKMHELYPDEWPEPRP